MLYIKNDDNCIESYYLSFRDSNSIQRTKLVNYTEKMNLRICKKVLRECGSGYCIQKDSSVDLSFFEDENDNRIISEIINSDLSNDTKIYLLNSSEKFKDFSFFAELIDSKIELKKYYDYQISELIKIKELCEQNKVSSNAFDIIKNSNKAEGNAKVLEFVRKVNKM